MLPICHVMRATTVPVPSPPRDASCGGVSKPANHNLVYVSASPMEEHPASERAQKAPKEMPCSIVLVPPWLTRKGLHSLYVKVVDIAQFFWFRAGRCFVAKTSCHEVSTDASKCSRMISIGFGHLARQPFPFDQCLVHRLVVFVLGFRRPRRILTVVVAPTPRCSGSLCMLLWLLLL